MGIRDSQNTHLPTLPINTRRAPANTPGEITNCAMASPPGSPSSRWWNRPIKPEPEIGPNELEVETMVAGDGYRYAKPGMTVSVHYVGYLPDGRVFDATHRRGAPLRFRLDRNEVIEGLDAAAAQLSAGERAKVRMGCDRAYGDRGFPYLVPPKTALVFDLEMLGAES